MIQPLWKTVWRFLQKLGIEPLYDPEILLLGLCPEKTIVEKTHEPPNSLQHYLQQLGHRFLIVKFRLKLRKVGKTTRPFWCDLNQIPYYYTVEVRNRFKGLDLIDRVPDELCTEVCDIVQETGIRPSTRKRNARKQNGCLRRPYK